jgi:tetratricopeptide (TPR) repeat protein
MSPRSKKKDSQEKAAAVPSSAPVSPETESRPAGLSDRWTVVGVCLFLAAITFIVFGQTFHYGFVNFDDSVYVYENPVVSGGLTLKGIAAMFTHVECNFYHPLTMISLMLNDQLNGLQPGGYHLANVLLHTLSAILLFLVLRRMTGFTWRSAFVAAVFAIHPLHVESVAWVSERKDVLSGVFFMLTLGAYVRYVEKTKVQLRWGASRRPKSRVWYGLMLLSFTLGLLSKPTLVTLPFVLLLLDYWPLNRFELSTKRVLWLVLEKIPLFALSAAASVMTVIAEGEAVVPTKGSSLVDRIGNPIMSYVIYMRQMVYPADLAPFYPFPAEDMFGWKIILALVLLVAISAVAIAGRRKRAYLLVGWLWYVGMLVPMIGIIQVGNFAHADRLTYLPMIGLSVALTWAVAELCAGWRYRRVVLGGCATVILVALIFCARAQTAYWRNSESLWTHTLACTSGNYIAHNDLGEALLQKGRVDEAMDHFKKAVKITPTYADGYYNLGNALMQIGHSDEAMELFRKVLEIQPSHIKANNNLGVALMRSGRPDEAIAYCQKAIDLNPDYAEAHYNLGAVFGMLGRLDEAVEQYRIAIQLKPDYADAHGNLANVLATQGKFDEAIPEYRRTLELVPDSAQAHFRFGQALQGQRNFGAAIQEYQKALDLAPGHLPVHLSLAWLLATCPDNSLRNGKKAVALAEQAGLISGAESPQLLDTLAAAYAEAGRFPEAIETARRALNLSAVQNNKPLAEVIQTRLKLYEAGSPFRDTSQTSSPTHPSQS